MPRAKSGTVARRTFLQSAAAAGAAALAAPAVPAAAQAPAAPARPAGPPPMNRANETETPSLEIQTLERSGSDFMVDVLKTLDFEFSAANPGSSFRALHESMLNHGGNKAPEWITCTHEEASVALAHGYAKIEGKPMMCAAHGTVGLQHAAMAIYNAFCDRVPVFIVLGNTFDATMRRPGAEWVHSVQDAALMVRDYVKWDDMPVSLPHFAESAIRAYKIAVTPPMAPVIIVADSELQEKPIEAGLNLRIPKLTRNSPPAGDLNAVRDMARTLIAAENPLIIADRAARTPAGIPLLVELAELLQAPVNDQGGRMNFPSKHYLASGGNLGRADVVLGLEQNDIWGSVNTMRDLIHRTSRSRLANNAKVMSISSRDLMGKANYQDFQRFQEVDLSIAADAEATLPYLIEEVKRQLNDNRRSFIADRGAKLKSAAANAGDARRREAAVAWDASPISTARMAAEIWDVIKGEDWSLVNNAIGWTDDFFDFSKHYHHIGDSTGAGQGYGPPASVGAALANKKYGRLSVNIGSDGDLMYVGPGSFWTAAHHRVPLLTIVHNNRAYHQELMHVQRMAARHERNVEKALIGNVITNPNIDYAKLAQSVGMYGEGPISNPNDLGPALRRALAVVKKGEPALVDVVTQPR